MATLLLCCKDHSSRCCCCVPLTVRTLELLPQLSSPSSAPGVTRRAVLQLLMRRVCTMKWFTQTVYRCSPAQHTSRLTKYCEAELFSLYTFSVHYIRMIVFVHVCVCVFVWVCVRTHCVFWMCAATTPATFRYAIFWKVLIESCIYTYIYILTYINIKALWMYIYCS